MNLLPARYVFVSYSHDNRAFASRLFVDLQARGIPVWIDNAGLAPGTPDWENAVREAISKAFAVILIASPQSRSSLYVRDELSIAQAYQHRIYPVWADGIKWIECIPLGYGSIQYIDARGPNYPWAMDQLVKELWPLSVSLQMPEASSMSPVSPVPRKQTPATFPTDVNLSGQTNNAAVINFAEKANAHRLPPSVTHVLDDETRNALEQISQGQQISQEQVKSIGNKARTLEQRLDDLLP